MSRIEDLEKKVLAETLKGTPKTATQIAIDCGFDTHHPIAIALSNLLREGSIVQAKVKGGAKVYTKA